MLSTPSQSNMYTPYIPPSPIAHTSTPFPSVGTSTVFMSERERNNADNQHNPYDEATAHFDAAHRQPDVFYVDENTVPVHAVHPHVPTQFGPLLNARGSHSNHLPAQQDARSIHVAGMPNYSQHQGDQTRIVSAGTFTGTMQARPYNAGLVQNPQEQQRQQHSPPHQPGQEFVFALPGHGHDDAHPRRNNRPCAQCQRAQSKVCSPLHHAFNILIIAPCAVQYQPALFIATMRTMQRERRSLYVPQRWMIAKCCLPRLCYYRSFHREGGLFVHLLSAPFVSVSYDFVISRL